MQERVGLTPLINPTIFFPSFSTLRNFLGIPKPKNYPFSFIYFNPEVIDEIKTISRIAQERNNGKRSDV